MLRFVAANIFGEGTPVFSVFRSRTQTFQWPLSSWNSPALLTMRSYKEIVLNDDDIEEKFVKGWGKGGQKVNKTSNCVELKHKPSGVIIKCHQSRSLSRNRTIAREILERKLDFIENGQESEIGKQIAKQKKRKSDRLRKRKAKEEAIKQSESFIDEI